MTDPGSYERLLKRLGVTDGLDLRGSTLEEAKALVPHLGKWDRTLRDVKNGINEDMKALREAVKEKIPNAGRGAAALLKALGKGRRAELARLEARGRLKRDGESTLRSFADLKSHVAKLMEQLEEVRACAADHIAAADANAPMPVHCAKCEALMREDAKFCSKCGTPL